jgi:hypothetical protein
VGGGGARWNAPGGGHRRRQPLRAPGQRPGHRGLPPGDQRLPPGPCPADAPGAPLQRHLLAPAGRGSALPGGGHGLRRGGGPQERDLLPGGDAQRRALHLRRGSVGARRGSQPGSGRLCTTLPAPRRAGG